MHDGRPPAEGLHIAFPAPDRPTVCEFQRAATAAGYRAHGAPATRWKDDAGYPAACVLDPDGHTVESVFHQRA